MVHLSLDDILAIRDEVARECANTCAVRALSSLYAAVETPHGVLFGQELFPSLVEQAGALFYGLIHNHPFWDGNKRIATRALRLLLTRNDARLVVEDERLRGYAREIARGIWSREDATAWLAPFVEVKRSA